MEDLLEPLAGRESLHDRITRVLARRVIACDRRCAPAVFPTETELCRQLGVSRTVIRESLKVLADKGMVEMKPRVGTRARPSSKWRLLDPDILAWQAESKPDSSFLRNLCEVRLAIEPTAAGFAALRATEDEMEIIERCLGHSEAKTETATINEIIDLDLEFHSAVVAASHNPLLMHLTAIIREPFRTAISYTSRFRSADQLKLDVHHKLVEALRRRDPMASRRAAEEVVGIAMLAVEKAIRTTEKSGLGRRH